MGKSSIGDSFSDRIRNHQEPIDHDQLIADMDLVSKNRKRPIFWILFVSLFTGIIGALFFYGWGQNDIPHVSQEKASGNKEITARSEQAPEIKSLTTSVAPDSSKSAEISSNHVDELTNSLPDQSSSIAPLVSRKANTNSFITSDSPSIPSKSKNVQGSYQQIHENQIDYYEKTANSSSSNSTNNDGSHNILLEVTPKNKKTEIKEKYSNIESTSDQEQLTAETISSTRTSTEVDQGRIADQDSSNQIISATSLLALRDSVADRSIGNSDIEYLLKLPTVLLPQMKLRNSQKSKSSLWTLCIESEVFAFQNMLLEKNPESTDYNQFRTTTENPLEGFRNGILVKYHILPFLYMKSGLQYNRYNRSFNYQENFVQSIEENVVTDVHINYFGDTTRINGVITSDQTINRSWTRHQHLNQINIPLYIGTYRTSGNWKTYLEAGLHMNVFQWFEGAIMDENFNIVTDSEIYKTTFANQVSIGVGAMYQINRMIGIDASVQYGRSINSLATQQYNLLENSQQLGIKLGIAYTL